MATTILLSACLALQAAAKTVRSPTPPMGWNSYNTWNCLPSESKIHESAHGLIDLGLSNAGYNFVTVDCGWNAHDRDEEGRLQWNETLFPSGGKALGDYLHDLGLDFGLYSGAGYLQCGSESLPASLGYEQLDAESFAEWGGDSLKYGQTPRLSSSNTNYTQIRQLLLDFQHNDGRLQLRRSSVTSTFPTHGGRIRCGRPRHTLLRLSVGDWHRCWRLGC